MIKIEIIDPSRENPETLVRLAGFLMECAGHKMVKAPDMETPTLKYTGELSNPSQAVDDGVRRGQSAENYIMPEEIDMLMIPAQPEGIQEKALELMGAAYQHCGESDLTHTDPEDFAKSLEEGDKQFEGVKAFTIDECVQDAVNEHVAHILEKPKKKRSPKSTFAPPELPTVPEAPPAVVAETVNGNTLVDKILKATTDGKLTHTDVTAIVKKHGLNAVRDIFTNAHLIPAINSDIDEVLK